MSSYCHIIRPQGFMAAQRSCFIKQGRPAVAFHTIVRRRTRCIPTSDQVLCPIGISRGKAATKADSAPPMSHPMQQEKVLRAVQKISNTRSKTQEETLWAANATTIGLTIIRTPTLDHSWHSGHLSWASCLIWSQVVVECDSLWQPKIQPSNGVHSVGGLVLYGSTSHSAWGILFNGIKPRQNRTGQTLTRVHAIHTAPLFHQIARRHKHLFTNHRQIPIDQIPSHG